ncbi:MAG: hypothetical protein Hens3KO_03330 [Henriciella sp.]
MDQDMQVMMARVAKLGEASESEAKRIVDDVYKDGIVSRGEAEALFLINDTLEKADPFWGMRFSEAIKDFLLTREAPVGWVTQEEAQWLLGQINRSDDLASHIEIDLILSILRYAQGAPTDLSRFVLKSISKHIVILGHASSEMVERMRKALYAPSGESGLWVNRYEAGVLFETNDAIAFAKNHPSWNDLFARAIANHLLARAHPEPETEREALAREAWLEDISSDTVGLISSIVSSFGDKSWFSKVCFDPKKAEKARHVANEIAMRKAEDVTSDEEDWLMRRLGWDQKVSPAERALIDFLKTEAPGFAHGLAFAA